MYAKRVTEAVELAKARAGAIMVRKSPTETMPPARKGEAAKRESVAAAGETAGRGE